MLADLQHSWVSTLYGHGSQAAEGLRNRRDSVRFEIYRSSLLANLTQALADTYPVIDKLVGRDFFEATAKVYLRRYPSHHGDIHAFGGDFALFMEQFEPARALAYLPDVARLEWLAHQAFHAADQEALDIDALAALPQTHLAALRLDLHPGLHLMQSVYPVHRIWQANQAGGLATSIHLDEGGVELAVFRDGLEIALMPLIPAVYDFMASLQIEDLATACEITLTRHPEFDPGQALTLLFSQGLVVGLSIGDASCAR